MSTKKDLTGKKIGRLTVINDVGRTKGNKVLWLCKCDCGGESRVTTGSLMSGNTVSCGCKKLENMALHVSSKKGLRIKQNNSAEANSWRKMIDRCYNPKNKDYKDYGGRGITVCEEWLVSFDAFLSDMGKKDGKKSIDRIDVNGNYEPINCRWADDSEQAKNRRNNVFVFVDGERMCVSDAAKVLKIPASSLYKKVHGGCYNYRREDLEQQINAVLGFC